MKITESQLRSIIREEAQRLLREGEYGARTATYMGPQGPEEYELGYQEDRGGGRSGGEGGFKYAPVQTVKAGWQMTIDLDGPMADMSPAEQLAAWQAEAARPTNGRLAKQVRFSPNPDGTATLVAPDATRTLAAFRALGKAGLVAPPLDPVYGYGDEVRAAWDSGRPAKTLPRG